MMVHRGHDDLVTTRDVLEPPRPGYQIQSFCGTSREDEAVGVADAEESGDALARLGVALRRANRQRIRAAMRIRVRRFIKITERVQNDAGLLRRRGRIEVVEPRIVGEQREVGAEVHGTRTVEVS